MPDRLHPRPSPVSTRSGFTLIELLIVVAIIAILAAIAVPNFLEAQTRAKVSRVRSDLRTLAIGIESYRVDNNKYPEGTDDPAKHDPRISAFLGPLDPGYYTIATRHGDQAAGRDFYNVTTPIAYVSQFFTDPFVGDGKGFLTYCYRPAKDRANGYVLTSAGPDNDLLDSLGGKPGCGTLSTNPLSTFMDTGNPARLGDINERGVVHYFENTNGAIVQAVNAMGGLQRALADLAYDPTNGSVSDGDIYRIGP